ncbi:MAG: ankyrin repeat domain-containing protein [Myxococcota bacterium]
MSSCSTKGGIRTASTGTVILLSAALVGASETRSAAATRLLIQRGADPDLAADSNAGLRPLHVAVRTAASQTVGALLEAGANPNATSKDGATAVHHALGELRNAFSHNDLDDPDGNARTASAFVAAHLTALSEYGADFNLRAPGSDSPPIALAASLSRCPDEVLDALLDGGANPNGVEIVAEGAKVNLLAACMFSDLSHSTAARFVDAGVSWKESYRPFGDRPFVEVVPQFMPELALFLCEHSEAFRSGLVSHRPVSGSGDLRE